MTKPKSCPPGKYWCFDDKKCKKIPLGYHIGLRGYLYPDEQDNGTNNGNGNSNGHSGNGNGSNGNGGGGGVSEMKENFKRINANGQTYAVMLSFRGRTYNIQMFIPKQTRPTRLEVEQEVNKIYPGAIVRYFEPRVWDPTNPALIMPESMQPVLRQKKTKKSTITGKKDCGCDHKEEFTLKKVSEVFDHKIDPKQFKKDKRDAKIGNLARKTTNPGEKAAAEKKSKGPKLFGEDTVRVEGQLGYVEFIDLIKPEPMKGIAERKLTKGEDDKKEDIVKGMKKSFKGFRDRYGDEAKSVMYATATKLAKEEVSRGSKPSNVKKKKKLQSLLIDKEVKKIRNEQLATHIKKGVAAAKPLVKAQALQTGLPTKEKPKPPEKKDSKSIFSQLTNKDEID